MEREELIGMRRRLDRFVRRFERCIKTRPSRRHFRTYVSGQVSDLPRKSIEPMALAAGVPPRSLQEFVGLHRWDEAAMRGEVQREVQEDHGDPNAIATIDDTGHPKKGEKTAGVQRQYCGATGKQDNCVITVHLGFATEGFHTLVDGDLYLPQSWVENRPRCREAGIPDEVGYRPKWQIALDLLVRAKANGVVFRYATADESYGRTPAFRKGVSAMGVIYVVEVPCTTRGWPERPPMEPAGTVTAAGRTLKYARLAPDAKPPKRVDQWWQGDEAQWQAYHVKDTEKGAVVWQAWAVRCVPSEGEGPGEEGWLLVARDVLTGEVKYFLSNAPADAPIELLLHIGFSRPAIERDFEDAKGQIGFDHFEVRQYRSLMRHLVLSLVSLLFLEEEACRLKKKRSGGASTRSDR